MKVEIRNISVPNIIGMTLARGETKTYEVISIEEAIGKAFGDGVRAGGVGHTELLGKYCHDTNSTPIYGKISVIVINK